jgi:hypothetical protein
MDRRGYLLFGAAAVCGALTSGFPEIEPSTAVVGGTREASGLLSLVDLGDHEYFDDDLARFSGTEGGTMEFDSDGGFTMLLANHDGDGQYSITARENGGADSATVLDAPGPGTHLAGAPMAVAPYTLDVTASGAWDLTLAQPESPAAEIREPPARAVGSGDAIVGPLDTSDGTLVSASHEGEGPFTVSLALEAGTGVFPPETLFDVAGSLEDEARTTVAGVAWIAVRATGSWTLAFDRPQ